MSGARPSRLAEAVLARVLTGDRATRALARRVRALLVRCGDPLVAFDVAGARLLAPLSHELPIYRRQFPHYDTALPRLARHLRRERGGWLPIVDVGANIGDTAAALLAIPETTVLAIEGDGRFFDLLAINGAQWNGRLVPVRCLLGDSAGGRAVTLHSGRGTGALRPGGDRVMLRTLADLIADHAAFHDAGLLKIDTDGFDIAVLRGAAPWLVKAHPMLFFEYDPHLWRAMTPDGGALFGELAAQGYGPMVVYDNFGCLVWTGRLSDRQRLAELDAWLTGRDGMIYADICVFPSDAAASFERFRAAELQHFTPHTGGSQRDSDCSDFARATGS